MFKVFKLRSVEPIEAFRIWQGKLFGSCPVQKPGCRRIGESKRGSFAISISGGGGGREESEGVERRGKE